MADLGTAYVQIVPSAQGIDESIRDIIVPEAEGAGEEGGNALGASILSTTAKVIAAGAAVVAASVAGIVKAASEVAEYGDEIDKTSQKIGFSTTAYQKWDYVMTLAGTDMASSVVGMKTLTNQIDDALNGSDKAAANFQALGLSIDDLGSMSREEAFAAVVAGLQGMEDGTTRAAIANDLFGKSGQNLTPLFNMTNEQTMALMENYEAMGAVMSEDLVADCASFEDALTTMKAALRGIGFGIIGNVLPYLTMLMDGITYLADNVDLSPIIEQFSGLGSSIAEIIENADWDKIAKNIQTVVNGIGLFIGTFKKGFFPIMVNVRSEIAYVCSVLSPLSEAIGDVTFQFDGMDVVMAIAGGLVESLKIGIDLLLYTVEIFFNVLQGSKFVWDLTQQGIEQVNITVEKARVAFHLFGEKTKEAANKLKGEVSTAFTNMRESMTNAFATARNNCLTAFENLKNGIAEKLGTAKSKVSEFINSIKSFFSGLRLELPQIRLPHFKVQGGEAPWGFGGKGRMPEVSIQWYARAMDNAMILDGATIFGASGGNFLGGGEAGREVVVGEAHLIDLIGDVIDTRIGNIERMLNTYLPACANTSIVLDNREVGRMVHRYV